MNTTLNHSSIDSKRWFILCMCILANLCLGAEYAWSVYAGPLQAQFGWDVSVTSTAFAFSGALSPITVIAGGKLQDTLGAKKVLFLGAFLWGGASILASMASTPMQLYLGYGVIGGCGAGITYSCTIASATRLFPDRRGFAAGLATAGYGGGALVFSPIIQHLISSYGVSKAFLTAGSIYLIVILITSFAMINVPATYQPVGWTPVTDGKSLEFGVDKNWRQMLRDPLFYLLLGVFTCGLTSGLLVVSSASSIAQTAVGLSAAMAATAVSAISLGNLSGRIIWGALSDKFGRYKVIPVMYAISAVSMFILATVTMGDFVQFFICTMIAGMGYGGIMGVYPALTADNFGITNNGTNYGFMFLGFSAATYLGPIMGSNLVIANDGSYAYSFIFSAGLNLFGVVLMFLIIQLRKKQVTVHTETT